MLLGGALEATRDTSTSQVSDHLRDEARRKALRSHVRATLKSWRVATASISRSTAPPPSLTGSAEDRPAIRVGLEPSSDVPRDEHECQRAEIPG